MNFKFPNHQAELVDPTIEKVSTQFSIGDTHVTVKAILNANGNKLYGVDLGLMPNTEGWGDAEVVAFANGALSNFEVQE